MRMDFRRFSALARRNYWEIFKAMKRVQVFFHEFDIFQTIWEKIFSRMKLVFLRILYAHNDIS